MYSLFTEGNMSPSQLFMEGIATLPSEHSQVPDVNQVERPNIDENDRVQVPIGAYAPCNVILPEVCLIDPLSSSPDFGKDLYYQVLQIVGFHLQSYCSICNVTD